MLKRFQRTKWNQSTLQLLLFIIVLYIAVITSDCGTTREGATRLGGITKVDEAEEVAIVAKLRGYLLQDDNLT